MTANDDRRGFSLRRWSQRKLAAAREGVHPDDRTPAGEQASVAVPTAAVAPAAVLPNAPVPATVSPDAPTPATATPDATPPVAAAPVATAPAQPAGLPPVESLTADSDFAAFLRTDVDEGLKRQALKRLFRDPRFNVMDGLDVYVDDYSKSDPIPPDLVRQLVQSRYILDPPATRVNAKGEVEDVPAEEQAQADAPARSDADEPPAQ